MKTIFTNSEICHVFNQQTQEYGKTPNGSMYFHKDKLYSYGTHYLLCQFIDSNTVLINNKEYSSTTAKHRNYIIAATSDKRQFFTENSKTDAVYNNLKELLNKLPRATKRKDFYLMEIDRLLKSYFSFVEYTKRKTILKKNKDHRAILRLSNDFYNNLDSLQETIKEQQIKQDIKAKEAIKSNLKKWKRNEINYFKNTTRTDFLRLRNDFIETSQGVKIPISEGKRLLNLIENKSILGQRVDNRFIVKSFDTILKVGCHNIDIKEINYIKNLI